MSKSVNSARRIVDANLFQLIAILYISRNSGPPRPRMDQRPMIVCSCNALRESQVREVARGGVRCEREAYQRLGCRPQCGQCLPFARQLVREEAGRVPA